MKLSTDPLRLRLSHSSSSSHTLPCAAGNLDTPRNRGAADTDLANARPVSPPASYLKGHQVTKCPCSWFGASFVSVPSLRRRSVGPRHLRSACTQVAICFVSTDARLEARSRSTANTAVRPDAIPVGDAGGHDGSEAVGQPGRYLLTYPHRPTAARAVKAPASHTGFRVQQEIWIRHVIAARQIGLWLTPDLFRLRRVT
jgi:hypothetical protein